MHSRRLSFADLVPQLGVPLLSLGGVRSGALKEGVVNLLVDLDERPEDEESRVRIDGRLQHWEEQLEHGRRRRRERRVLEDRVEADEEEGEGVGNFVAEEGLYCRRAYANVSPQLVYGIQTSD